MEKKLKTDEFDLDSGLDFNFDEEMGSDPFQQSTKKGGKREVVTDLGMGIVSGAVSTATDPSFIQQTLRSVLPKTYGEISDGVGAVAETTYDLYDHTVRELKPRLGQVARKIDQFIPEGQKTLKKISTAVMDFAGERRETQSARQDSQEEQAVTMMLGSIFEQNKQYTQIADKKQFLHDTIDLKRHNQSAGLLGAINQNTSVLSQYTTSVTQAWQRKTLELQLRSYLMNKEHYSNQIRSTQESRALLEGIMKNTALPEYQKITMSERFMNESKQKFAKSLFGDKSPLKGITDAILDTGKQFVDGIVNSLEMVNFGLDGALAAKEMNDSMSEHGMSISKATMGGEMLGGFGINWVRDKFISPLRKHFGADKELNEKLSKIARVFIAPAAAMRKLQNDEEFQSKASHDGPVGWLFRALDAVMDNAMDSRQGKVFKTGVDQNEINDVKQSFDKKAHISITEIIPGHLAAIHREIKVLRTGDENTPLNLWNYSKGKFETEKEIGDKIVKDMKAEISNGSLDRRVTDSISILAPNGNFSPETQYELKIFFNRLARIPGGFEYTPENIRNTQAFESLSKDTKMLVDTYLKNIENSDEKEAKITDLQRNSQSIREATASMEERLQGYIDQGYGDIITKRGLLNKNSMGNVTSEQGVVKRNAEGKIERDDAAHGRFIEENAFVKDSDINIKESIKEMKPAELLKTVKERFSSFTNKEKKFYKPENFIGPQPAFNGPMAENHEVLPAGLKKWAGWQNKPSEAWDAMRKTKLFDWKYKKSSGNDTDPKVGPMAQEVQQNFGEEAAPTGKKIDLVSLNGAAMASVKHLGDRLSNFMRSKGESKADAQTVAESPRQTNHLANIDKNIAKLLKVNEKAMYLIKSGKTASTNQGDNKEGSENKTQSFGNDYAGMTGQLISSISNLGIKISKDVFGAVGSTFNFAKDNIAKPTKEYLEKNLQDENSPLRKGFASLFDAGLKLGKGVIDSGTYILGEFIPKNLKKLKDFTSNVLKEIGEQLNAAKDLYLPGGVEPVIRAAKLSSGFYIEAETGKPIVNMEQLLKVKGDIVDSAGNILLSAKERAAGLFDREGKRVKTIAMDIASLAIGAGVYAGKKLISAAATIKNKGLEAFANFSGWSKDKWKNLDMGSSFGFGFDSKIMKESNQVLVDIRDILLGKIKDVRKRLKEKATQATEGEKTDTSSKEEVSSDKSKEKDQDMVEGFGYMPKSNVKHDPAMAMVESQEESGSENKTVSGKQSLREKVGNGIKRASKNLKLRIGGSKPDSEDHGHAPKLVATESKRAVAKKTIKGVAGGIKAKALSITGGLGSLLSSGNKEAAQEESAATSPDKARQMADAADTGKKAKTETKGKIADSKRAANDKDGDGVKDGSVEEAKNKQAANKAAHSKDFQQADLTRRYGGGDGLGMLFSMVKSLFGLATKGLGGLFSMASGLISKLPGFGKIIRGVGSLLPSAGTVIRAGWGVAKFAVGTAARAAAWSVMTAAPAILSGVASVAGTALSVVGSIIGSPVVIGAVAVGLIGYGLYRLYKRSQRNNASDLEKLRLRQYGFAYNDVVMAENYRLYTLEAYLQDGRVGYDKGKAYLIEKNIKTEELLEIFSIDKDDKEQGEKFALWFKDRFKPIFLTHLTALGAVNSKLKLDEVNDLKPAEAIKYIQGATFESGPYNIDYSPVKTIDSLSTDKEAILQSAKALLDKFTEEAKKGAKESKLPVRPPKPEDNTKSSDAAQKLAEEDKKRTEELRKANEARAQTEKNAGLDIGKQAEGDGSDAKKAEQSSSGNPDKDQSWSSGSSNIPLAPGAPSPGTGGMQFVRLANGGVHLEGVKPNLLQYFLGMAEEYGNKTGKTIQVNDGFRSYDEQARLHAKDSKKAAPPGKSLHEFGLAMDINSGDAGKLEELGLMKKYGFTRPVGGEPWHIEPAGVQKNIDLARRDASAAERMIDASLTRGGGGYGTVANADKYRRNTTMAINLLDLPGKQVKSETKSESAGMMLADNKPQGTTIPQNTALPQSASNDASVKNNVIPLKQDQNQSTSKTLPTPKELLLKASYASDGEKKPSETEGTGATGGQDGLKEVVSKNAKRAGVDPNLMLATAAVESDFKPNAKNPNSSAMGLYQFMPDTFSEQLAKHGAKYGLPQNASPFDPEVSTLLAAEMMKSSFRTIAPVKPDPNATDAYLTHFLGPSGAKNFLSQSPAAIGADLMPKPAKQNKEIFFDKAGGALTIKDIYNGLSKKIEVKSDRYGIDAPVGNFKGGGDAPKREIPSQSDSVAGGSGKKQLTISANASPFTSPTGASEPNQAAKAMVSGVPKTGLHVDTRGASLPSSGGKGSSEISSSITTAGIESRLDRSIEIQKDTVAVLKDILENVKTEKVAAKLSEVLAQAMKGIAANKEPSLKEKDDANMGRRMPVQSSSVDFSRKTW